MPEIWLSYGHTDVVLDIRAENLDKKIEPRGTNLTDAEIVAKLEQLDLAKPAEFVILNYSKAVEKVIFLLIERYDKQSISKPKVLVDKYMLSVVKKVFSNSGLTISEFDEAGLTNSNLVFVGELEFDGLFGYDTISTKLVRRFGKDHMLTAYEKRKGDLPSPGEDLANIAVAQKFTDAFEISAVEMVANSSGIIDLSTGHPSSTSSISKSLLSIAKTEEEKHRSMIISTGKESSGRTLGKSLTSLWNCAESIKEDGLAILLAECGGGVGSEAIQQYMEGRMSLDRLKSPAKYVDGMEDLLFFTEIEKKFQIGMVSILPEFYTKDKLSMLTFNGIKEAVDHILKAHGARQKIAVVPDGSHVLLRQY